MNDDWICLWKFWIKRLDMISEASVLLGKRKSIFWRWFFRMCECLKNGVPKNPQKYVFSYSKFPIAWMLLGPHYKKPPLHYEQCSKPSVIRWHSVWFRTRFPWMMSFPNSSITRKNHHHLSIISYYIPICLMLYKPLNGRWIPRPIDNWLFF